MQSRKPPVKALASVDAPAVNKDPGRSLDAKGDVVADGSSADAVYVLPREKTA